MSVPTEKSVGMFKATGWTRMDLEDYTWKGVGVLEGTQMCNMFVASG